MKRFLLATLVSLALVIGLSEIDVHAQGPFAAQITQALQALGLLNAGYTNGQVPTWNSTTGKFAPGSGGGGGSGCVPSGTIGQILSDSGSGTCVSNTTGTGVVTALGVNIGSAGAVLTFNGAGGTPSSIVLTHGTGLPWASVISTPTTFAGYGISDTLANLFTAASFTASSLLDTIGSTRGSVLYRGASGWALLTPGTSGDVLEAQGTGADPIWNTPSGIGLGNFSSTASSSTDGEMVVFNGTSGKSGRNSLFVLSGPATTAKTYTFPNASANVLTDNALVMVPQGGTAASTLTAHGVLVGEGTGAIAATAVGTSGQVLTSNGAGNDPTFQPASGGGGAMVLLEEHTGSSSADLEFTTFYSATYDDYVIRIVTLEPATTTVTLEMQVSTDGGSTWVADGNYYGAALGYDNGGAAQSFHPAATNFFSITAGSYVTTGFDGVNGQIDMMNPGSASVRKAITFHVTAPTTSAFATFAGSGVWTGTTAVNAVRFLFSSGNIASGTIRIYGLTH